MKPSRWWVYISPPKVFSWPFWIPLLPFPSPTNPQDRYVHCIYFGEVFLEIFCPFVCESFVFLLLSLRVLYILWIQVLYLIDCKYFLLACGLCGRTLSSVQEQKFFILIKSCVSSYHWDSGNYCFIYLRSYY